MEKALVTRALETLWLDRNLHFLGKAKDDKVRYLINHFNQSFSNSVSNDKSQSIVKHMVTFKG